MVHLTSLSSRTSRHKGEINYPQDRFRQIAGSKRTIVALVERIIRGIVRGVHSHQGGTHAGKKKTDLLQGGSSGEGVKKDVSMSKTEIGGLGKTRLRGGDESHNRMQAKLADQG